jgi:hypothetical protein
MEVTRNVVLDLLPLYRSGEASADTRAIVEDYLNRDPTLRRLAEPDPVETPAPPPSSVEKAALERTRRLLRRRSWTMGLAIFFTLLPFTFGRLEDGFTFLLFRDVPWSRALWVVAAGLWLYHARLHGFARRAGF